MMTSGLSCRHSRCLPLYIFIVLFGIGAVFRLYKESHPAVIRKAILPRFSSFSTLNGVGRVGVKKAIHLRNFVPTTLTEASCVREVLETLKLPLSRSNYFLQSFQHPLDLTRLSRSCQAFLIPHYVSSKRRKELNCFLPEDLFRASRSLEWDIIRSGLLLIRDNFDRARIPISIDAGTALGSWRMHGQIPYDHDIDFLVLMPYKSRTIDLMKKMQKQHPHLLKAYKHDDNLWRFSIKHRDGSDLILIDVFFHIFRRNDSIIQQFHQPTTIKARTLLPFIKRPFEGILFKTWRNMLHFLPQIYGKDSNSKCQPGQSVLYYNKCGAKVVNCSGLNFFFNFARRWEQEDGKLVEVLFNRSHALSVFYSPDGV